ncbi:MAG: RNA polymerase sigma factor [Solirubrobacterales bacterium]
METLDTSGQEQEGNGLPAHEHRRTAALALIARYDKSLRRTARRFSLCADDADDAYQRALEILLRKGPVIEPERLARWMHTVTRHEAYAVRRQRSRGHESTVVETEDGDAVDALELVPSDAPQPDEGVEREERIARGREALKSLKPHEVRALTLKAEGYSYAEISEMTGWSRT